MTVEVSAEAIDSYYNYLLREGTLEDELRQYYNDVELWILRGRFGKTNFDLLEDILNGKKVKLNGETMDS